jgi:hypothetical protein
MGLASPATRLESGFSFSTMHPLFSGEIQNSYLFKTRVLERQTIIFFIGNCVNRRIKCDFESCHFKNSHFNTKCLGNVITYFVISKSAN